MRLSVLILLGLTLCWPIVGFAFTADKRDTLRGLREISVLVEYLPDDVEREGLSREHLTTRHRSATSTGRPARPDHLRDSEVTRSPVSLRRRIPDHRSLSESHRVRAVGLTLKQLVQLSRNPTTEFFATTWEGPAPPSWLSAPRVLDIRTRISDAVGRFIIDYQAVNPK